MLNEFVDAPFTLLILLINLLIGIYTFGMDPSLIGRMALTPIRIREHGEYYRFVTGGFVHAGWAHLAFNMFTLFFFGPFLERKLGLVIFLIVYLGSGLAANLVSYLVHRKHDNYSAVGASGSIAGIVFAFCLFEPFRRIILFLVVPMPAWVFAIAFVGFSIYAMKKKFDGELGRIAHEAHLGGAIGGAFLTILFRPDVFVSFLDKIGL